MRILQISHYYPPHIGGLENFVHGLSERLQKQGHEVAVLTTTAGGAAPGLTTEAGGIRVLRQGCWNGLEARNIPWPIVLPEKMPQAMELLRWADVVHAHGILFHNSALGCAYARLAGKPLVVTEHVGIVPYRSPLVLAGEVAALWSVGRAVIRLADAVVVVNRPVHDQMARLRSFRGDIEIIPYGVDTDLFRPVRSPEEKRALRARFGWDDKPRVVCVGRMTEKKGMDVLLRAAHPSYEIVLCGPGKPPELLEGATHVGALSRAEVADLLRAADIFSLPSVGEGFPLSIQEAMATALPLVITDDPRYWAYLKRTEVAMVPQDPVRVRAAIQSYLADPAAAERAGAYAREAVRRLFSWDAVLAAHERLYEKVHRRLHGRRQFGVVRYDLATLDKLPELAHLMATESGAGAALDLGTGTGFTQSEVLRGSPRVVVDAHRPNLELCRRSVAAAQAAPVLPVLARAEALPFKTGSFRSILFSEVLEHCEDDRVVVAEVARVLAPNGALVLSVPGMRFGFDSFLHLLGLETVHDREGPEHHYRPGYPLHDLKPLLEEHGLALEEVREYTGLLSRAALDTVSLANLAYQRLVRRRKSFSWKEIAESEQSLAFRAYRKIYPLLRAVVGLDRNLPTPKGFQIAVRARRVPVEAIPLGFDRVWREGEASESPVRLLR
jgi:glycosyltransferase involved in cell wall biosynthesis/2-polyprenyl-3-methyl-5-hydroxy-6-metoxy-1,4-benzoquinol methylase